MVSPHLRPTLLSFTVACLGLLALLASGPACGQGYIVIDVGSMGGNLAMAFGINDQGHIVGQALLPDNVTNHPFYWDPIHGMQDLGTLPGLGNGFAEEINDFDQVVGALDDGADPLTNQHAFIWDSVHGLQDMGTAGTQFSAALGINDAGQITGAIYPGANHAFLHNGGGPLSASDDLGLLPGGTESFGESINYVGQVAGGASTASGSDHPMLWDQLTGIRDLGLLPGGTYGWAQYLNDSGDVVGFTDTALGPLHAFVYSGGEMTDLGSLPGYPQSIAAGIDSSGSLVVGVSNTTGLPFYPTFGPQHAVLWREGVMYDLNSLVAPTSGWVIEMAVHINGHGQISGTGYNGSQHHALRLDPIVLSSLTVSPSTVPGCKSATGKVTLSAPAVVDAYVELASQNPAASVPTTVKIAAGKSSATFPIKTIAVTTAVTGQITGFDGDYQSATLTVRPIGVKALKLSPTSVVGGNSVIGTVTLECPAAPGSITVSLSSSNSAIANPAVSSITIPAGSQAGTFTVNTSPVSASTGVTIKASANGISKSGKLTVNP